MEMDVSTLQLLAKFRLFRNSKTEVFVSGAIRFGPITLAYREV